MTLFVFMFKGEYVSFFVIFVEEALKLAGTKINRAQMETRACFICTILKRILYEMLR